VQAVESWPFATVGGFDFVRTDRWELKPGERAIDLQVSLDDLPVQSGWQLAIHERTVRDFLSCLGWPMPEDAAELVRQLDVARADAEVLREALREARDAQADAEAALATITKVQRAKQGAAHASAS
jgi:hypothetical protein